MKNSRDLEKMLKLVEKPARYIGHETGSITKDPDKTDVKFGFAFPDTYEIGMSYMGLQILYNILNKEDNIACERVFSPARDMEKLMREEKMELFTLENKIPLSRLDILGFTLQYEMSYTNILNILELGNIPLLCSQRSDDMPLIAAGGPCAYNPEPLSDFIDVFMIGDGEELIVEFTQLYAECRKKGLSKHEFLEQAAHLKGVYVPSLYSTS